MVLVVCTFCRLGIRILGMPEELDDLVGIHSDWYPNKYPCPQCEKPCEAFAEEAVDPAVFGHLRLRDLSPPEALAAFYGLGLPHERACALEDVQSLLREQPVRRVLGHDIAGSGHCCIEELELWDGTRVRLGSSAHGAVVYCIRRPPTYAADAIRSTPGGNDP